MNASILTFVTVLNTIILSNIIFPLLRTFTTSITIEENYCNITFCHYLLLIESFRKMMLSLVCNKRNDLLLVGLYKKKLIGK